MGGLRIVGGRPRTGPIFRGIGGRFPAVNAEAVQTRELRRVRFQFTIPAFNSYFQTQPKGISRKQKRLINDESPKGKGRTSFPGFNFRSSPTKLPNPREGGRGREGPMLNLQPTANFTIQGRSVSP